MAASPDDHASALDVAALSAVKVALGLAVLAGGFVALSDDDFSRVVIAQRFAAAPALDPSGTSWLPLPFWLTGTAMAAFGRSLGVARAVAMVSSVVAALLVHRAARWLGASRAGALAGSVAAVGFPTALRLGVSFQPEALTAGLIVLGAAATAPAASRQDGSRRLIGALALAAACLCRYEAWPAAAVYAALAFWDSGARSPVAPTAGAATDATADARPSSQRGRALVAAGALALAAPVAWVIHGALTHGDALFFAHRVAAYRRAVGASEPWLASLAAYPRALLVTEPELVLAAGLALVGALRSRRNLDAAAAPGASVSFAASLGRPLGVIASVLAFLIVGRLLDGAPTHHAERTLLPVWTWLAITGGEATVRLAAEFRTQAARSPWLPIAGTALGALILGAAIREGRPSEPLADRAAERAIGDVARRTLPADARLAIDTPDYGYFAVIGAFGAPERAEPLDRHDPREPKAASAFASAPALREALAARRATWLVASRPHWPRALELGKPVAAGAEFVLIQLRPLR